jgi:hypothetical protein
MNVTPEQTEKLLKTDLTFSLFGFSMMATLLKKRYAKEPTQAVLQDCTDEINAFISKYESILANDLAKITQL